ERIVQVNCLYELRPKCTIEGKNMLKKIPYIIIYLLCFTNVSAQQQIVINRLLDSIKSILNDTTISENCKINIKQFQEGIRNENKIILAADAKKRLIKVSQKFVSAATGKNKKECD